MKRKTIIVLGIDRTWDLLFGCCCWGFHGMINSKLKPKQKWYGLHSGHRVLRNQRSGDHTQRRVFKMTPNLKGMERVRHLLLTKNTHGDFSFLYKPARRRNLEVLVGVGLGGAWAILPQGFP